MPLELPRAALGGGVSRLPPASRRPPGTMAAWILDCGTRCTW
jgi:hypothetical protein